MVICFESGYDLSVFFAHIVNTVEAVEANTSMIAGSAVRPRSDRLFKTDRHLRSHGQAQTSFDFRPVGQLPPRMHIVAPAVLIVQIVRVFPHIQHQHWNAAPLSEVLVFLCSEDLKTAPCRLPD